MSYVWGDAASVEQLPLSDAQGGQALPKIVPRTLEDALVVVLAVGGRYIWIDRYCIDQREGSEHRAAQLAEMDSVFESSVAWIVAAGSDANAGLPGVSVAARAEQTEVRIDDLHMVCGLQTLQSALESSRWLDRGWTYQGAYLSPRMALFTGTQVYFMCMEDYHAEAIAKGSLDASTRRSYTMRKRKADSVHGKLFMSRTPRDAFNWTSMVEYFASINFLEDNPPVTEFQVPVTTTVDQMWTGGSETENSIEIPMLKLMQRKFVWQTNIKPQPAPHVQLLEYTERKLTNDSDVLNAFRGLLKRSANTSLYGVPIFMSSNLDLDLGFVMGLAWARFEPAKPLAADRLVFQDARRCMFPTWSGASVKSPVGFVLAHECHLDGESTTRSLFIDTKPVLRRKTTRTDTTRPRW